MKSKFRTWLISAAAVIISVVAGRVFITHSSTQSPAPPGGGESSGFTSRQSREYLKTLLVSPASESGEGISTTRADYERMRRFDSLWAARQQRDITNEIIPFLRDPHPSMRDHAARALGRLENALAEAVLLNHLKAQEKLIEERDNFDTELDKAKKASKDLRIDPRESTTVKKTEQVLDEKLLEINHLQIPELTIQLAVGRIRSRGLHGKAKIETALRSIKLSWEDFLILNKEVNSGVVVSKRSSPAGIISTDIVSLLYVMGKQGDDIRPLVEKLTLTPAQQLKLKCATLPVDQELELMLTYLTRQRSNTTDATILKDQLIFLKPDSTIAVLNFLPKIKNEPSKYRKGYGHVGIFDVVDRMGDPRAIPILKSFNIDSEIKAYGKDADFSRNLQTSLKFGHVPSPIASESSARWTGWQPPAKVEPAANRQNPSVKSAVSTAASEKPTVSPLVN